MYMYVVFDNCSKVHISSATKNALNGEFVLVEAHGRARNEVLEQYDVDTYFVEDNSKSPEVRSCDCHVILTLIIVQNSILKKH